MKKLYKYMLSLPDYILEHYFGEKAFTFKKVEGNWSRSVTISKYRKTYDVHIIEGTSNMIKVVKKSFTTYKEVLVILSVQ